MDQESKQPRRVKVTDATAHRTGTRRATVKPHKRATEPDVKKLISDYMSTIRSSSLRNTYYGDTIAKNATGLCNNFGIAATDEPYLLVDPTGTGRAGMLLSSTGVHLADGRGGTAAVSWKDLPSTTLACQRGMIVIGQSGVTTSDAQVMTALLQQIQAKFAQ
ncbi:MAG: hypothetical protein J6D34_01500 [Atopobiaceae bacterium]|nr:hypothetical protein [Pseudomonas sp.]MBP3892699.1 hypothetical protein [Atopobiaceae bacterium]